MDSSDHLRILAVCAYGLLAISVVTGEFLSGRLVPAAYRRRLFTFHRASSTAGLVAAVVHAVEAAGQGGLTQVALGLTALVATATPAIAWVSRRRLALRWRAIHHAAYLAFAIATVHAIAFHAPAIPALELGMYAAAVSGVVGLAGWRVWLADGRSPTGRAGSRQSQS